MVLRLTIRVDPTPPYGLGCRDFFKISWHILTYFTILYRGKLGQIVHICLWSDWEG